MNKKDLRGLFFVLGYNEKKLKQVRIMLKKIPFYILFIFLSGCTIVEEEKIYTKDKTGFNIDCSGSLDSWQFCHNKAKDLCPTGYEVLSSNESQKDYSLLRLDPGLWVGTAEVNPYLNRRMFVACK